MTVDLSKLILDTPYNAFKNITSYSGTLTLPGSVPPATTSVPYSTASLVFSLSVAPVFTQFFAYFNDVFNEIIPVTDPQWYNASIAGSYSVGYNTTGQIGFAIGPIINGTNVTIQAQASNQTASTFSSSVTVPFVFIEYTLAN